MEKEKDRKSKTIKMLLGKRARAHMKRTTSMSEIMLDQSVEGGAPSSDDAQKNNSVLRDIGCGSDWYNQRFPAAVTPTPPQNHHRRRSTDFVGTPIFLRSCGLCRRRLVPGRDIYMYRGDNAFCSLECRQHQMMQDERKEKYSLFATTNELVASSSSVAGSKVSAKGSETLTSL